MSYSVVSEMNDLELTGSLPYKCFSSLLGRQELQGKPLKITLQKMTRSMWHDLGWYPDLVSDDADLCVEKGIFLFAFSDYWEIVSLKISQSQPSFPTRGIILKPMTLCLGEVTAVLMYILGYSTIIASKMMCPLLIIIESSIQNKFRRKNTPWLSVQEETNCTCVIRAGGVWELA